VTVDDLSITAIVSLVSLLIGFALGNRPFRAFQNRGELTLLRTLNTRFTTPDYHLLNHVTLRLKNGATTQIDHILVSRFGIFVIETKDYSGWIFANPANRQWTQVLYRAKFRFQNPIRQNHLHVSAVRELLDFLPPRAVISAVVFTGRAEFKTPIPEGVFHTDGFVRYLETRSGEVLSMNRVQFSVGRLETARLSITRETDVQHVQQVRQRYGRYE
jgi:hypothetical protein